MKIQKKAGIFAATFLSTGRRSCLPNFSLSAFFMPIFTHIAVCNPRVSALMCLLPVDGESQRERASRFFYAQKLNTL